MIRLLCLASLFAVLAAAQSAPPDPLAALERNARSAASDWETLSQKLDPSTKGLLPCDPKIAGAIERTSLASQARIAALQQYLQAAGQRISRDTEAAKRVLASAQALAPELAAEKTDVAQEVSGIEGQLADLEVSAKARPPLNDAETTLRQILESARKRAALAQSGIVGQPALTAALQDLVTAFENRETAFAKVAAAYETEQARWKVYYAARLARARAECALVQGTVQGAAPASAPPQRSGRR